MREAAVKILIIDDDPELAKVLGLYLRKAGHQTAFAPDADQGLEEAGRQPPEIVLLDRRLPGMTGLDLLPHLLRLPGRPAVVMMTGMTEISDAVAAIKLGAEDYLSKPFEFETLDLVIQRVAEKRNLHRDVEALKQVQKEQTVRDYLFLSGQAMQAVYEQIEQVAEKEKVTVLILGETGTGKEHAARLIHLSSPRAAKPFVELHCAALPESLLESELFGFEAGAFTDAKKQKKGLFEMAQAGTLFLDEVGELPLSIQTKLLKVLEQKQLRRLGGLDPIDLDVRVVAATNRDLEKETQAGRFRADLYYRLNVFSIRLPPLRDRGGDIVELAKFFFDLACRDFQKKLELTPQVIRRMQSYPWPGNIRELKNSVERMVIRARGGVLKPEDMPEELRFPADGARLEPEASANPEAEDLRRLLNDCHWNRSLAAQKLGISRPTLLKKMKDLDIYKM